MEMKRLVRFILFLCFCSVCSGKEVPILLSNNGGNGGDWGLTYSYPYNKPNNPSDTFRDKSEIFGNRLLNGEMFGGNWWDPVGTSYNDLTVDFTFPQPHRITKIRILMVRPQKPKIVEVYSRISEDSVWLHNGNIQVESVDSQWYEFNFDKPTRIKDIRLIFKLKERLFYVDEVEILGIPGYVSEKVQTVIEGKKLYIVKDGNACAKIIVSKNAKEKEKKAAELIHYYIYRMTGAGLPIITDENKEEGTFIVVGQTALTKVNVKQANYPEPERYLLKREGKLLYIVGNDAGYFNGTKRSAYLFLEHLGCGFYGPTKHWQVVPKKKDIYVEDLDIDRKPVFSYRAIWWLWNIDPVAFGLGGVKGFHKHNLYSLIPPSVYFKEHPEYFALVDGKRLDKDGQICFSNPDVQKIAIGKIREYFDKDPDAIMYSLSPEDWGGFCECEGCNKLGQNPSEKMLAFANIIGKELKKTHPDKYVIFYAYWYTAGAPENMKAEDNVVVMVIDNSCKAHSLTAKSCPGKEGWINNFLKWKGTGAKMAVYQWYIPGCNDKNWQIAPYLPGESALEDLRLWKKMGAEWIFYESFHGEFLENSPLRLPMYYTVAKGMEDLSVTYDNLMEEACKKLFGPASSPMKEFYLELSRCLKDCPTHSVNWTPPRVQDVYSDAKMTKLRKLLIEAWSMAVDNNTEVEIIWRINDVIKCWMNFEQIWKDLPVKDKS